MPLHAAALPTFTPFFMHQPERSFKIHKSDHGPTPMADLTWPLPTFHAAFATTLPTPLHFWHKSLYFASFFLPQTHCALSLLPMPFPSGLVTQGSWKTPQCPGHSVWRWSLFLVDQLYPTSPFFGFPVSLSTLAILIYGLLVCHLTCSLRSRSEGWNFPESHTGLGPCLP